MDDVKRDVHSLKEEMISLRRKFHRHPELGMQEIKTARTIEAYLKKLGLDPKTGIAETGVSAVIQGKQPGKTLMLRADMDALPIREKTGTAYASVNDGVMHACAHDGHMAILLTVAKILCARRNDFKGNIKLVFQPGEEGLAGAYFMIHDGVLEKSVSRRGDGASLVYHHSLRTCRRQRRPHNVKRRFFLFDHQGKKRSWCLSGIRG